MIPQGHAHFYAEDSAVSSEWPNQDGGNTLPTKDASEELYPFDPASVSAFCKSVFDNHMCDSENLKLVYDAGSETERDFVLNGYAYEYCRFSCGQCLQTGDCYATHNNAMQFLARDPDANTFFLNDAAADFGWDNWGFSSDNDDDNETDDWSSEPSNDDFYSLDSDQERF